MLRSRPLSRPYLRVTLGAHGAALQHGLAVKDALGVNVQPRVHIVECCADCSQALPEGVVEGTLCLLANPQSRCASVEGWVHGVRRLDGGRGLHSAASG